MTMAISNRWGRLARACPSASALVLAATLPGCDPGELRSEGCDETTLRDVPSDATERGPWDVGVRTVQVGELTVEVWYPAHTTNTGAYEPVRYDVRKYLSEHDRARISDDETVVQTCDCYRDLAIDGDHGPYPVVVFLHAYAGFRTQSLRQMVHWASRGFVVISADYPGNQLRDALAQACTGTITEADIEDDVRRVIAAAAGHTDGLAFLGDHVDAKRIGIVGHSAGGRALASLGDVAQVLIPMAAGGVEPGKALRSTLVLGGTADRIVPYAVQRHGYATSPSPKRLVGIRNAGHLAFSEACVLRNDDRQNLVEIGIEAGLCGMQRLASFVQCDPGLLPAARGWAITNTVTSAALEETLHCAPEMAENFDTLQAEYGRSIAEYRERP